MLVNDAPQGLASPFALKAAEELGRISIGLPGQYDATGFLVLRDVRRRFRIAPRGIYLAGFSEGARRARFRWMNCLVYDAGHSWGPAALHEDAVRWLARVRLEPGFLDAP